jgi:hypothetical protein
MSAGYLLQMDVFEGLPSSIILISALLYRMHSCKRTACRLDPQMKLMEQ